MDKILYAIVFSLFMSLISTPALTCSRQGSKQNETGAACSVAELDNMSKYRYAQENSVTGPPSARDLRPVQVDPLVQNDNGMSCKLELCLSEKIFKGRK